VLAGLGFGPVGETVALVAVVAVDVVKILVVEVVRTALGLGQVSEKRKEELFDSDFAMVYQIAAAAG